MFDNFIQKKEFIDFHRVMMDVSSIARLGHTMVGFNYSNGKLVSTKFYYIFHNIIFFGNKFPVLGASDIYEELIKKASLPHIESALTPGSGLTFAIKFDEHFNVSKGFFFRVDNDNEGFIRNISTLYPELSLSNTDFESGYGQYVMSNQDGIKKNEYLYLNKTKKLSDFGMEHGIDFSCADGVEISCARDFDKISRKFIAIGLGSCIGPEFKEVMPEVVTDFAASGDFQFCCPAVAPACRQYSVYIIGRIEKRKFVVSPIHELLKRRGVVT